MPNVTLYLASERMPSADALARLTVECSDLCTGILRAALENVHIVYVPVAHGRGYPAFAEVLLREAPFRSTDVLELFMRRLDEAIVRTTGLVARIRCFSFAAQHIHARN
ncbi:hypothetical protein [Leifsonia aquatica]|uniref:hypothetical protein n=1 Tax=Leifsonia aquatica TaxID=144185 RepID=UPI0028A6F475|nr:hypothetical protein [Leifsonia aquatica]